MTDEHADAMRKWNPAGPEDEKARAQLVGNAMAEEAERIGAAFQAMEYSMVATLSAEGVEVSFHGDGRVTGSHRLKAEEAAHAILDLGRKMHSPLWQPIEMAPKDGTRILVCRDRKFGAPHQFIIWWEPEIGRWSPWGFDADFVRWTPLPPSPEAP